MSIKTAKLRDGLFGGLILGGAVIIIILVCCLPRRIRRIRHEDISSISRRYQSYQDCARVPYAHGNPSQIDRVDIVNISVISANLANQESSCLYRNATFVRNMTR